MATDPFLSLFSIRSAVVRGPPPARRRVALGESTEFDHPPCDEAGLFVRGVVLVNRPVLLFRVVRLLLLILLLRAIEGDDDDGIAPCTDRCCEECVDGDNNGLNCIVELLDEAWCVCLVAREPLTSHTIAAVWSIYQRRTPVIGVVFLSNIG